MTEYRSPLPVRTVVLAIAIETISSWSSSLFGVPVGELFADRSWPASNRV